MDRDNIESTHRLYEDQPGMQKLLRRKGLEAIKCRRLKRNKMAEAKKKGESKIYWMRDTACIGLPCFMPGENIHRASVNLTCLYNANRGCPIKAEFSGELAATRRKEGWEIK